MPKVSVLMPVYNEKEDYLREAISSILEQTFRDFEFMIINDGSDNNVEEVIFSYDDDRIVYIKNEENLKLIKTLNKGLKLAKGEYIVRMDSDDISKPNRIEASVDFMEKHPKVVAAGSYAIGIPRPVKYTLPTDNTYIRAFCRYIANCMMHPAMILRASVLRENNLSYDENYLHCEDFKLWIELNKIGELANIPEFLLEHRLHDESVSFKYAKVQQRNTMKILFECLFEDFGNNNNAVKEVIDKFFKDKTLSLKEFRIMDKFLSRVLKRLFKIFTDEVRPYINNVYTDVRHAVLSQTKPSGGLMFSVFFSKMNKYLLVELEYKLQILQWIFERMINEAG